MVAPQLVMQEKKEKEAGLPEVVMVIQPNPEEEWSSKELTISAIGFFCCSLLGLPAMIMAILGYVDHSNKAYTESKAKRRRAGQLGVAAIVVGVLLFFAMLPIVFHPMFRHMWHKKMEMHEQHMERQGLQGLPPLPPHSPEAVRLHINWKVTTSTMLTKIAPEHHTQARTFLEKLRHAHAARLAGTMPHEQMCDQFKNMMTTIPNLRAAKGCHTSVRDMIRKWGDEAIMRMCSVPAMPMPARPIF